MISFIKTPFFAFCLLAGLILPVYGQTLPHIQWEKSYGGQSYDLPQSIEQTTDKGFIIAGMSYSDSVDIAGHHGTPEFYDYWIIKLDSIGNLEWQRSLGGDDDDVANCIKPTPDGGYVVAGYSKSNNGDISGNHGGNHGNEDYWIVKLDENGKIIWQYSYGGSNSDRANSIALTPDGGYIIAGSSASNDGDVTAHHGSADSTDFWVIKLNASGNLLWEKSFGGSANEEAFSVMTSPANRYIIAGFSNSVSGDVTENHGSTDYWIVMLDSLGNISWQKSYGGSGEEVAYSIEKTSDDGFVIAGYSFSKDWNSTKNQGQADYWILKLDADGNPLWQKSYGGSDLDAAYSIRSTFDNGFIVAGFSSSKDGDVTGNHEGNDFWCIKLSSSGLLEWQQSLGGTDDDLASAIIQTSDSGYIVLGSSSSFDGDVIDNNGQADYWIVKLATSEKNGVRFSDNRMRKTIFNFPNPFSEKTTIQFPEITAFSSSLFLYNLLGVQVRKIDIAAGAANISFGRNGLPSGKYVYRIMEGGVMYAQGNIMIE